MNQLKFKIKDVVYYPGRKDRDGMKFVVTRIEITDCRECVYLDNSNSPVHVSHLELYQEPQKKKLYAYKCSDSQITFYPKECSFLDSKRVPEYDIEYPEATK